MHTVMTCALRGALVLSISLSAATAATGGGEPPPVNSGGGSTNTSAAPSGPSGTMSGSGPFGRDSIMPELPPKMPEADALAAEDHLDAGFAFERLKLLEGTWEGTAGSGSENGSAEVTWELTAAGTALVERQFAGRAEEMMSVYYVDGDDLVLTHYCAAGNQPQMRFDPGESVPNLYTFRFNGGTNIGKNAAHVHAGTIHFVNANQIKAEWVVYAGSRKVGVNVFDLRRKTGS